MNTSPNTLNTVLKYVLCLYILLGSFIHTKFHLSRLSIKIITICLITSIFLTVLYDPPLSLLFCIASMVFVMSYVKTTADKNKQQNELFEQTHGKIPPLAHKKTHSKEKEVAETHTKQKVNDGTHTKQTVNNEISENTIISRSCNVKTDPIQEHLDKTKPHLEDVQTNVFDKLNYNIHFNELKVEHYNTQGINEQEPDVIGYDSEIFIH